MAAHMAGSKPYHASGSHERVCGKQMEDLAPSVAQSTARKRRRQGVSMGARLPHDGPVPSVPFRAQIQ